MRMTFQDITHPDDLVTDLGYVQSMLAREIDHYSMEKRYIRKNAGLVWINLTVSLVWTASGQPDYFISVVEDISLRKAAELEIKKLRNSLVQVQEAERRFVALELHDEFGQRLSAANIALGLAQRKNSSPEVHDLLTQVKLTIDGLITTTRAMAQQLHPAQLDHFGISSAVRSLVNEVSDQIDIDIFFDDQLAEKRFDSTIELVAYRVIQEAVSNALRHSKSDAIKIVLSAEEAVLKIKVSDSGVGIVANSHAHGLGLLGMQERVDSVGGVFFVQSGPDLGTLISVVLPAAARV
jgi:signal transduction histidine kinase